LHLFISEISVKTLRRIKKEGSLNQGQWNTPGKKRPHSATISNLDDFDINAIRNKLNEFYCVKKQVPTLRTLHTDLVEAIGFRGCRETLRKILHNNGFEFLNNKNERAMLIEKYEIAAWRHRYLRTIQNKRLEGKQIIYIDETYVHQHYKLKKSWQGPSTSGVTSKISSGKRHIIVHAGSEEGFVPGALLVFSTKSKLADYHDDMNSSNFMKWLEEMLLPNLNKPCVLVMDNASYHVKQMNKPPTMSDSKANIQKWLQENNIDFERHHTKAELMCFVRDNKLAPVYEAEEILKKFSHIHNHEILYLPPYHCDLNAIELVWSQAKRQIASKNIGRSGNEMENLIKESFESITMTDWKKYTDHVINVEHQYKIKDGIVETELEKFIINVGDTSSSESSDTYLAEYLETDFSYDS
jgi:transposase